ncbi:hypothetical protein [Luteibacter aegosomaticola]
MVIYTGTTIVISSMVFLLRRSGIATPKRCKSNSMN